MIYKTYTLFLGLNDKDSKVQEINTIDAYKILQNILPDCTIRESQGIYTYSNGIRGLETTLELFIIDFDKKFDPLPVIDSLKRLFNQESIALVTSSIDSDLF